MNIDLKGKTALITGASKGIGRAIATEFAKAGAHIIAVSRDANELEKLCKELPGGNHHFLEADFSQSDLAINKISNFLKQHPIDILVNNTGGPAPGPIEEASWDQFLKGLEMHLKMSQGLSQCVLPNMKENQFGRIINVISTSVKIPIPGLGVSNTVRGAMASWSKTLASEVGMYGITVNNILPGFIKTGRLDALIDGRSEKQKKSPEQIANEMVASIPAGRFGKPEELAYYATFLASEMGAYINGTSLQIDGGRTGSL